MPSTVACSLVVTRWQLTTSESGQAMLDAPVKCSISRYTLTASPAPARAMLAQTAGTGGADRTGAGDGLVASRPANRPCERDDPRPSELVASRPANRPCERDDPRPSELATCVLHEGRDGRAGADRCRLALGQLAQRGGQGVGGA